MQREQKYSPFHNFSRNLISKKNSNDPQFKCSIASIMLTMGVNDSTKFQSSMDQPWVIEFQYCQSPMVGQSPMDQPWVIGKTEIQFWIIMLHEYQGKAIKNYHNDLSFQHKL